MEAQGEDSVQSNQKSIQRFKVVQGGNLLRPPVRQRRSFTKPCKLEAESANQSIKYRPVGRHAFGLDAAQEPRVNISPPHCQGANINMGPGIRTVAKVDALPKVCKDKMGAESVASHFILLVC
ncbi:hypothetical protein AXF42_Ash001426 [Apostasia shenzhenica]|uniref:Uncharacterized protein n=1 Tax=Apostasia shenzhenica TaxID=1088818 RepID=A0A2I0AUW7_9ASPA|nr:hypothetical protein AXF42_Ash001426 [Apostasia shenzhenica]